MTSAEELVVGAAHAIPEADAQIAVATQKLLDNKTKPVGSLGRLETLAVRLAASQGTTAPRTARKVVVVAAADHGVANDGVSAFPQAVTQQMVKNFVAGGAAVSVLARVVGARVAVVDMGVIQGGATPPRPAKPGEPPQGGATPPRGEGADDGVIHMRIGNGTRSIAHGPAMTRDEAARGVQAGLALALALAEDGLDVIALGEMGIGNSTSAAALIAALTGRDPREVTGRGTGVDDATYARKLDVVASALTVNRAAVLAQDPLGILAALGGFEIAGLCGVALGAASIRVPVVLDGLISTAAGLVAMRLAPTLQGHLIAGHLSPEPGHVIALEALGLRPLLTLDMRLGEGSGATMALALVDAAARILAEMATFDSAGVSGKK